MFKIYPSYYPLFGGAKINYKPIYCGKNERVPKGRIRGRPNQCFNLGRKIGYYAGISKGRLDIPMPDIPIPADIPEPIIVRRIEPVIIPKILSKREKLISTKSGQETAELLERNRMLLEDFSSRINSSDVIIPRIEPNMLSERERLISTKSGEQVVESLERGSMMGEDILSKRNLLRKKNKSNIPKKKTLLGSKSGEAVSESLERGSMMGEDIRSKLLRKSGSDKPSIKELYKNVPKTTRLRDFMAVLPLTGEYQMRGSKYLSVKNKKALGTEGLKKWILATGQYKE